MIKPNSLREAIVAALPDLAREPERLSISIEKGKMVATGARPAGTLAAFEYRYTLVLTLLDFAGDPDLLFAAIIIWTAQHQREIADAYVAGDKDGFSFDVDVLDSGKVDLEVQLGLTEAVGVTANDDGVLQFEHYAEPQDADQVVAAAMGLDFPASQHPLVGLQVNPAQPPLDPPGPIGGGLSGGPTRWGLIDGALEDQLDLVAALAGKQPAGSYAAGEHNHDAAEIVSGVLELARIPTLPLAKVNGLEGALAALGEAVDGKAPAGNYAQADHVHDAGDITSGAFDLARIPSLPISKVNGLQLELDGKLASSALDADPALAANSNSRAPTQSAVRAFIEAKRGAASGLASLGPDGLIPATQLPPVAIKDTLDADSESEMLALDAQRGDMVIRSDIAATFVLRADDPTDLASWRQLPSPLAPVQSVNGKVGVVNLTLTDLGAQAADADLTQLAAIDHVGGDIIQDVGGVWRNRTLTQILSGGATLGGGLLFSVDGVSDIGAAAANRPRDGFFVRNIVAGGNITAGGDLVAGATADVQFSGRGRIRPTADGVLTLMNSASTGFTRLNFGGTTNAFPALKRNGAGIDFRLADDSAYCTIAASFLQIGGTSAAFPGIKPNGGALEVRTADNSATAGILAASYDLISGGFIRWAAKSMISSPSVGVIKLSNDTQTDFSRLQFGGTSAVFPALKRSGTALHVRTADDSGWGGLEVAYSRPVPVAFAGLPAAPTDGMRCFITDCNVAAAGNFGAAAAGGGANHVPVYYDGGSALWRIG